MPTGYTVPTTGPRAMVGAGSGPITVPVPVVIDHETQGYSTQDVVDGQAIIAVPPPGNGYAYQVEIIDLWSNSSGAPVASVYVNSVGPTNEVDYSSNAGHDVAYENPPIYVPSGQALLIVWSGLSDGSTCTARVQYSVLRYVPVTYES